MDQAKLIEMKKVILPVHTRIGNFISGIFDFWDLVEMLFGMILVFLFGLLASPFVFLYEVLCYLLNENERKI